MNRIHRAIRFDLMPTVTLRKALLPVLGSALAIATAGCGLGGNLSGTASQSATAITQAPTTHLSRVTGLAHGGQQPVTGASVALWAAGVTSGYGALDSTTPIATATTDGSGNFNLDIPSTTTSYCTIGQYLYITVTGGNPGGGVNPSLSLITAIPTPCSASTGSQYVYVNEVTTVATVWALQQFMSINPSGTPAWQIGTPSTNTVGLANAFAQVGQLVNITTGLSATSYVYNTITNTSTSTSATYINTVTPDYTRINMVADILAFCINSTANISVSGWSVAGDGVTTTFSAPNQLSAGQYVTLSGFAAGTFLNGQTVQVISAGLSGTQFEAVTSGGTASTLNSTDPGTALPTNSSGVANGSSTNCTNLFNDIVPSTATAKPTDTIQAAYDIANAAGGITIRPVSSQGITVGQSLPSHSYANYTGWAYYMCNAYVGPQAPFTTSACTTGSATVQLYPSDFEIGVQWTTLDPALLPTVCFSGGGGSGATAQATVNSSSGVGQVNGIIITNGGSGYSQASPPTITIGSGCPSGTDDFGSGATATANVNSNGVVTSATVTAAGTGYYGNFIGGRVGDNAVDANGNVWMAMTNTNTSATITSAIMSEFDPTGRLVQYINGSVTFPASAMHVCETATASGTASPGVTPCTAVSFTTPSTPITVTPSGATAKPVAQYGLALDTNGNAFAGVNNFGSTPTGIASAAQSGFAEGLIMKATPAVIAPCTSIPCTNGTSTVVNPTGIVTGGYPGAMAIDGENNIWVNAYANSAATYSSSKYYNLMLQTAASGYTSVYEDQYSAGNKFLHVIVDGTASHDVWYTWNSGTSSTHPTIYRSNVASALATASSSTLANALGISQTGTSDAEGYYIALDSSNNLWSVESTSDLGTMAYYPTAGAISPTAAGSLTSNVFLSGITGCVAANTNVTNPGGICYPPSISIDGLGTAWLGNGNNTTNSGIDAIYNSSGTLVTLAPTFNPAPYKNFGFNNDTADSAFAMAIDPSGNVWEGVQSNTPNYHMIGMAAPVITPISVATTSGTFAISSWSITSNVATFTLAKPISGSNFTVGDTIALSGFSSSTGGAALFNNQTVTVATSGSNTFTASFTASNVSTQVETTAQAVDFSQPGRLGTRP